MSDRQMIARLVPLIRFLLMSMLTVPVSASNKRVPKKPQLAASVSTNMWPAEKIDMPHRNGCRVTRRFSRTMSCLRTVPANPAIVGLRVERPATMKRVATNCNAAAIQCTPGGAGNRGKLEVENLAS